MKRNVDGVITTERTIRIFSTGICMQCPTGEELRWLGRYFDTEPKDRGGKRKKIPNGLTPERVHELNMQGIADKRISIMYDRIPNYISKLKMKWKEQGLWEGPTNIWKLKRSGENARNNTKFEFCTKNPLVY